MLEDDNDDDNYDDEAEVVVLVVAPLGSVELPVLNFDMILTYRRKKASVPYLSGQEFFD
jgi:hypothetical protein